MSRGRPKQRFSRGDDPAARFAAELRDLRIKRGTPSYREMEERAKWSHNGLCDADNGHKLPTKECLSAYLRGLGITDEKVHDQWQVKWQNAQCEIHLAAERGNGGTCDGSS